MVLLPFVGACLRPAPGTRSVLGVTKRPFCSWQSGPSFEAGTRYAEAFLGWCNVHLLMERTSEI